MTATTTKSSFVRKQLLIDHPVQIQLLKRVAFYTAASATYFLVILVLSEALSHDNVTVVECLLGCLDEAIYWAPGFMLMAPIAVYDLLQLTNRFAGPMFSMRREMRGLIEGASERPLTFRDEDHWNEMSDLYNQIRQEMLLLREENAQLKHEAAKETTVEKLFDDDETDSDALSNEAEVPIDDLLESVSDGQPELAGV